LGPVDVVEDHDKRPTAGDRLKDIPHTPQQLVLGVAARAGTHEGPDPQRGILAASANERPQLGPRLLFVILEEDPGRLAESLSDGPEGEALPVVQAPAPQHLCTRAYVAGEFLDQPGLAQSGLAEHGNHFAVRAAERAIERIEQPPELLASADDGKLRSPRDRLAVAHAGQPVGTDRLGLALQFERFHRLDCDSVLYQAESRLADENPATGRRLLEPGSHID